MPWYEPLPATLQVQRVLAGCHSLVYVDGELVGDPLELAGFNAIGATLALGFQRFAAVDLELTGFNAIGA